MKCVRIAGSLKLLSWALIGAVSASGLAQSPGIPQQIRNPQESGTLSAGESKQAEAEQKTEPKSGTSSLLAKVKEWRIATEQHHSGEADPAARKIAGWPPKDTDDVLALVAKLAAGASKRQLARAQIRRSLDLTDQEVKDRNLDRILARGALLHTDIALLQLEKTDIKNARDLVGTFRDGQIIIQIQPKKRHWEFARRLIDAISPAPLQDRLVKQWYISTTAYLQSRGLAAYAHNNIQHGQKKFPANDRILFYAGILHELWASPYNQNILLPQMGEVLYGSKEKELKLARQFFEKSIAANPACAEAHLHLGRVLGMAGDYSRSVAELQESQEALGDAQLEYYAALHLGYGYASLSEIDKARDQFERASLLYPNAQSPLLALSQLALGNDNHANALAALNHVFALQVSDPWDDDPWWNYSRSHVRNADALIAEMYKIFGDLHS